MNTHYDVVILGSGPAGLQAAIHAARKKVSVLILGKESKSSLFHAHIENFCCIFNLPGEEMLRAGREQAVNFGAEILEEDVLKIDATENIFQITTEGGQMIHAKTLIVATGTSRNRLGVKGEKELLGKGVSYCVECDANFFRGEDVAVVGGESAAVSGALTLLHYAKTVHLVCEKLQVAEPLEKELRQSRILMHEGQKVTAISGENRVEGLALNNGSEIPLAGVFIELGAKGVMELATTLGVALDEEMKYIATNKKQETNIPGIYAAGDICGPPWQMAKAVGEGCVAGLGAATDAKNVVTPKRL